MKTYKLFIINPGSTSTKISLFEDKKNVFTDSTFHDSSELLKFPTINDQLEYRMQVIRAFIKEHNIDLSDVDAIIGRGGGCYSVEGGVYRIDDRLIQDTREAKGGLYHSSMLGVQMAAELQKEYGGEMFMMDPPVLDEYCDEARITGVRDLYRTPISHALNLRATAFTHAAKLGKKYSECNFICCHIDGGISITAHRKGRMIDGNNAGGGEGPFTPTRMGSLAVTDLLGQLKDLRPDEIRGLCSQSGGLSSHFHTSNSDTVHKMVEEGDPKATRIWNAMIYQVCKYIGSMACALNGQVDAIVLTGGLLRFDDVVKGIEERCGWIAPIALYPGEFEQEAMASGALRVLRGEEEAKTYSGRPAWEGFKD